MNLSGGLENRMNTYTHLLVGLSSLMMFACSSDSVETGGDSSAANSEYGMSGGNASGTTELRGKPSGYVRQTINQFNHADLIEICDGFDNDADGKVDENGCTCDGDVVCFAGPPEKRGVGECTDGERQCGPVESCSARA